MLTLAETLVDDRGKDMRDQVSWLRVHNMSHLRYS